jgi:hypothetical protein
MRNYLKSKQCNMWLRMFSSEWCGRTEVRSKIDKLYGIVFYLTEMYSYMNRYTMTLKYFFPNLRHCFFTQTLLIVSSSHCITETPSNVTTATQHVVRWEVVSQRASCWGHYWHGLSRTDMDMIGHCMWPQSWGHRKQITPCNLCVYTCSTVSTPYEHVQIDTPGRQAYCIASRFINNTCLYIDHRHAYI